MTAYVILSSWNDVLYKLEAWSPNYYLSKMYYDQFLKKHSDSIMVTYSYNNTIELSKYLKMDVDAGVDDILMSMLKMRSSIDKKCYIIYKNYDSSEYLSNKYDSENKLKINMLSIMGRLALSIAPLTTYLNNQRYELLEFMFKLYMYNKITPTNVSVDIVYTWNFISKTKSLDYMVRYIKDCVEYPSDSIFIKID